MSYLLALFMAPIWGYAQMDPESAEATYPTIHIPQDSANLARLKQINRDIWQPFSEAYADYDAAKLMSILTGDFIRATGGVEPDIKDFAAYREHVAQHFDWNKETGFRVKIAFTFFERAAGETAASERGIYRYTRIGADSTENSYYGRFHVIHKLVNGTWKIAVDYDSNEDWTISEGDFFAGRPTEVLAVPEMLDFDFANSEDPEFAATITPDGNQFFFNRTTPDRKQMFLFQLELVEGDWMEPAKPSFSDSGFSDIDPMLSPNGQQLFFTSNRPTNGKAAKDYDIWVSQRRADGWSPAKPLGSGVNSPEDEVFCSLTATGDLYFSRFIGNKAKIFRAAFQNGNYLPATEVKLPGTDTCSVSNPAISPDGKWLVFTSSELGGKGSADLFASQKMPNGQWSAPRNLAGANCEFADFAPAFSPDGQHLFFTSERPGVVQDFPKGKRRPGDLYRILWDFIRPETGN